MMSAVTLGWLLLTPQTTPTPTQTHPHPHGSPCKPEVQLLKNEKTNRIWFFFFTSLNSCLANFSLSLSVDIHLRLSTSRSPSLGWVGTSQRGEFWPQQFVSCPTQQPDPEPGPKETKAKPAFSLSKHSSSTQHQTEHQTHF